MSFINNLDSMIEKAETSAASGCGLSDVLYEMRLQDAYQSILDKAPQEDYEEVKKALKSRGYDENFTPYQPQEDECMLTGIETRCCPCGRHP